MTARTPLVFGADGVPQQLQSGDSLNLPATASNTVLAGPSSGSAAAPGFRGLVVADLPYPPARQPTIVTGSAANGSFSTLSYTGLLAVGFVATATSADVEAKLVCVAATSGQAGQVNVYVDVYDTAAGASKAQGNVVSAYVTATGYVVIPAGIAYSGLTVGSTYQIRVFAASVGLIGMNASSTSLKGVNL